MRSTTVILTLQELIKKVRCDGLVNSAVIEFKDGSIQSKGNGIEVASPAKKGEGTKVAGKVDGSMAFEVRLPMIVQEPGEIAVANLQDLLSTTEIFEKDDIVTLSVQNNKLVMSRELPVAIVEYDLADRKFVPSAYKDQANTVFGSPVTLKNTKGATKEFPFTAEVVMDASQLKAFAAIANKISATRVPLQVKDGKFISALKGNGKIMTAEIKTDKAEGNAEASYNTTIIEIFNIGFGLATIRFATDSVIYVHYELNQQKADYFTAPPAKK